MVPKQGALPWQSLVCFADVAQAPSDCGSETRDSTLTWQWKYQLWFCVWTSPRPNIPLLGKALNSIWNGGSALKSDYVRPFYLDTAARLCRKYMCSSATKNLPVISVPWSINRVVTFFLRGKANNGSWNVCCWLQENGLSRYHLWNCYTYIMKLCQLQPLCKWMHTLFQTLCCSVD